MLDVITGIGIGIGLSALNLFAPKIGGLGSVCSVLLAQSKVISPSTFLIGTCIQAGFSGALLLINKYFNEQSKQPLSTETASRIANTTAQSSAVASLPISIGIGAAIMMGAPAVFAGLSKTIALLSVPLTILLAILTVSKLERAKRLPYIIGVSAVTALALAFIIVTGNPLAMAAIASVTFLGKPAKQQKHKIANLSDKTGGIPTTNNMWITLMLSTIMIGLPTSSLWNLLKTEEKATEYEEECRGTMLEILSNHCSMLLFLMLGMARSGSANNLGIIVNAIDPITAIFAIGLMIILQIWAAYNLPFLCELYLTKRPKHNGYTQWLTSVGCAIVICLLIGLPLNASLIFVGAGLMLGTLLDTLDLKHTLTGMFSNIPLVGITMM